MGAKTLLTVEHLERLPQTGDVSYELDQGELVEVSSAGYLHNRIRGRVERFLGVHLDNHPGQGSNTVDELARKTQQYLEAGTRAVWIFVTAMREIHIYSATAHPAILTAADLLEDATLLPGFSARVEELFAV